MVCCTDSRDRFNALETELRELREGQVDLHDPPERCRSMLHGEGGGLPVPVESGTFRGARSEEESTLLPLQSRGKEGVQAAGREERKGKGEKGIIVQRKMGRNSYGRLRHTSRVDEGVNYRLWVIGKYDTSVRREYSGPARLESLKSSASNLCPSFVSSEGCCGYTGIHPILFDSFVIYINGMLGGAMTLRSSGKLTLVPPTT